MGMGRVIAPLLLIRTGLSILHPSVCEGGLKILNLFFKTSLESCQNTPHHRYFLTGLRKLKSGKFGMK
jgi:hypothetical protein